MGKKKGKMLNVIYPIALASFGTMLVLQIFGNSAGIMRHKHNESGEVILQGSTSMTTSNSTSHPKNIFVGGRMIGMSTSTTTSSSSSHPVNLYRN